MSWRERGVNSFNFLIPIARRTRRSLVPRIGLLVSLLLLLFNPLVPALEPTDVAAAPPLASGAPSATSTPMLRPTASPTTTKPGVDRSAISPNGGQFSTTGSLNDGRYLHTATLLPNGKVLVAGGSNSSGGAFASAELYDPSSETWSTTGSLNLKRWFHSATLLPSGKVLVVGGGYDLSGSVLASAELYDPSSETWSATGSLKVARQEHTATLLPSGKVLVAGGYVGGTGSLTSAELYDPSSGTWTTTGSLNVARTFPTATLLPGGKVLVAGGGGFNGTLASTELYDPATGTWSTTGSLNVARYQHSATLLPNGKVVVVGGNNGGGSALASAELYDPSSGTWGTTGSPNVARFQHTATLLPIGKVLVVGGATSSSVLASAELYDPATETWTTTGSLNVARTYHTATLLPNGKILVAAGSNDLSGSVLTSAELYDATLPLSLLVGVTRIEPVVDSDPAGTAEAFAYRASANGTVTELQVYLDPINQASEVRVGLYTDLPTHHPGTLLTSGVITGPANASWNTVTVPAATVTKGTRYWLALLAPTGKGRVNFRDVRRGSAAETSPSSRLSGLPLTWAKGQATKTAPASLAAVGQGQAGGVLVGSAADAVSLGP